ncbi:MAG: acyl-CoA desaturase [Chitinophagales bacterium]|nr:acyl-CoA desaturase [Chitinophagales bacterium]
MKLLDYILIEPRYGWTDANGEFVRPTVGQMLSEYFYRINIFRDSKNWFPLFAWVLVWILIPVFLLFIFKYFTIGLAIAAFLYGLVLMASHGTMWYHRYSTHSAFVFKSKFWRFISQHLVIKMIPEELYVISHHVHHDRSDRPGDPYNAFGGFLYCFLADTNHQLMNRNLSSDDYKIVCKMMEHTGCQLNSYEAYQKYGTIVSPWYILWSWILNWLFWGTFFYFLGEWIPVTGGGWALVTAMFAGTFVWAVGIRTFNYGGHGAGKGKKAWGDSDYFRGDYSINQLWPGFVAGEWHNNHHVYGTSARAGFLPYQLDLPFWYVKLINFLGGIESYRDNKAEFLKYYYEPYKQTGKYVEQTNLPKDYAEN